MSRKEFDEDSVEEERVERIMRFGRRGKGLRRKGLSREGARRKGIMRIEMSNRVKKKEI